MQCVTGAVCTRLNQELKLEKACLANPNMAAPVLMVLGWGNEDQEEVYRPGLQSPTPSIIGPVCCTKWNQERT